MSQDNLIGLQCQNCDKKKRVNYTSRKNRRKLSEHKILLNKYCKWCNAHTSHKEAKKQVA